MKVKIKKVSDSGYTFKINFGPFWVGPWWYSPEHNNITPPSAYVDGKRYVHVFGHGMHFKRLRDLIALMVERDIAEYDTESLQIVPTSFGETWTQSKEGSDDVEYSSSSTEI